jgi:hypothetical protein
MDMYMDIHDGFPYENFKGGGCHD